jgi:hypothetical protein
MRKVIVIAAKAAVFIPCCAWWLWWSYSMHATVNGGFYTHNVALRLVIEMSLITTCLIAIVWIASPYMHQSQRWIGLAIKTALETWLLLALYTSAVFMWRDHWNPAKGMSEGAAFMPVIGHVNAAFFAESGWLEYFIAVIPAMSVLSGILTSSMDFLQRPRQIKTQARSNPEQVGG